MSPRSVAAAFLGVALLLAGCSSHHRAASAADPATDWAERPPTGAPTEALVRAEMAPLLTRIGLQVVFYGFEDGRLGVYLQPERDWTPAEYLAHLGETTSMARDLAARHPQLGDIEVCEDARYIPRSPSTHFVTATRVQIFQKSLGRLPARLPDATAVMTAERHSLLSLVAETRIQQSPAYLTALRRVRA